MSDSSLIMLRMMRACWEWYSGSGGWFNGSAEKQNHQRVMDHMKMRHAWIVLIMTSVTISIAAFVLLR